MGDQGSANSGGDKDRDVLPAIEIDNDIASGSTSDNDDDRTTSVTSTI